MDVNKENRKKESTADWILNLDFNPEGVIHPFMFQIQHSLCSEEEEPLLTKKAKKLSFKE